VPISPTKVEKASLKHTLSAQKDQKTKDESADVNKPLQIKDISLYVSENENNSQGGSDSDSSIASEDRNVGDSSDHQGAAHKPLEVR
jgi:hypothetical protein